MNASIAEWLIVIGLCLGGSFGIPMGVPPGEEDPIMYRAAPEDCLMYATWTGVGELDKNNSPTEAWLAHQEIQKSFEKLKAAYHGSVSATIKNSANPVVEQLGLVFQQAAEASTRNPVAFYLTRAKYEDFQWQLEGAGLISLKERLPAAKQALEAFERVRQQQNLESIERINLEGLAVYRFRLDDANTISFAIKDQYFLIGFGAGSMAGLLENLQSDAPPWLTQSREELTVDRFCSLSFIDSRKAVQVLPRNGPGGFFLGELTSELIAEDLQSMTWVSGLVDEGFITRCQIRTEPKLTGILRSIDRDPIKRSDLQAIPATASLAIATRISAKEILQLVTDSARRMDAEDTLEASLGEFQKITGVSLKDELIDALGDLVVSHYSLDLQDPASSWVGMIRIDDEMSFPAIFEKINRSLERSFKERQWGEVKKTVVGENEFYSYGDDNWSRVTWGLIDDRWYFSNKIEDIQKQLAVETDQDESLAEHPVVVALYRYAEEQGLGPGPVAVVDVNFPSILKALRPFWNFIEENDTPVSHDFDFRWSDLPPIESLIENVEPNIGAVYRTPSGFQIIQLQTFPGASPGVSGVAASSIAMPYAIEEIQNKLELPKEENQR